MLQGQSISLVRNDVDSSRAHFVTATFRFGLDVKLTDVPGCNGTSFELRFSNAQYVRYSGYSKGDFGEQGIMVVDRSDISTGDGRLYIGVLSGNPAGSAGIDDPVAVRLDFVVTPDAPHENYSTFSFVSAKAVVNSDSGAVIDLRGDNNVLAIRSFIKIWPGDANNDGKVNTNDISTIGSFLTNSDNQGPFRGFKRNPSSAYWVPQTALAWDSVLATSADCDGSGEVTLNDILVVQLNFFRERTVGKQISDNTQAASPYINSKPLEIPISAIKIPVYCRADRSFIGAAARIAWSMPELHGKVIGIEPGELSGSDILCYSHVNQELNYADIAVGTINADTKMPGSNRVIEPADRFLLCYLIVDSLRSEAFPLQMLQHPTGITASGQFFPLELAPLSTEQYDGGAAFSAEVRNSSVIVKSDASNSVSVTFYDILGNQAGQRQTAEFISKTVSFPLPDAITGLLFAVVRSGEHSIVLPLSAVR
ncbi:hypothetical protein MASR2M18_06630 [Ignavibacteria bacterium]